jgi:selenocysteine lyase/cysteine desulfurase
LEGVRYILKRGVDDMWAHEQALIKTMIESLTEWGQMPGFQLLRTLRAVKHRCGVFSVRIDGLEPHELAGILESEYGILTRSGSALCAGGPQHDRLDADNRRDDAPELRAVCDDSRCEIRRRRAWDRFATRWPTPRQPPDSTSCTVLANSRDPTRRWPSGV